MSAVATAELCHTLHILVIHNVQDMSIYMVLSAKYRQTSVYSLFGFSEYATLYEHV